MQGACNSPNCMQNSLYSLSCNDLHYFGMLCMMALSLSLELSTFIWGTGLLYAELSEDLSNCQVMSLYTNLQDSYKLFILFSFHLSFISLPSFSTFDLFRSISYLKWLFTELQLAFLSIVFVFFLFLICGLPQLPHRASCPFLVCGRGVPLILRDRLFVSLFWFCS